MNAETGHWHFARPELAERYLWLVDAGAGDGIVLSGPEGTGKSEFLRLDIEAAAHRAHKRVLLIDLAAGSGLADAIIGALKGFVAGGGHSAQELPPEPANELLKIRHWLELAAMPRETNTDTPLLLLIDNADLLSDKRDGVNVASALLSAFTCLAPWVQVVFAENTAPNSESPFTHRNAPFHQFGSQIKLPPFGREFLLHLAKVTEITTGTAVALNDVEAAFEAVGRSPGHLIELLSDLKPGASIADAVSGWLRRQAEINDPTRVLASLRPLEQAILQRAALARPLAARDAVEAYATFCGRSAVHLGSVSYAIESLLKRGVLSPGPGEAKFRVVSPELSKLVLGRTSPLLPEKRPRRAKSRASGRSRRASK